MKFSIIGCQHAHISIFIEEMLALGHQCAGVYERENVTLAENISKKYSIPIVHDEESLFDETIDIVGCAAINNEKIDVIEKCERHGKHIMIDKPAVTNRKDLVRFEAVINRGNIKVGMLLTERFRSPIYTVKKFIDEGGLGKIVSITMRKPHLLNPSERPEWHFSKQSSGGIIIDLFIHDFDLLRWLTGREIDSISGFKGKNILPEYPSFHDVAGLSVVMEGGVVAQLYADWHTAVKSWTWGDGRIFIVGTNGTLEIRLEGDPLISKNGLSIKVTHEEELAIMDETPVPITITEDFMNRVSSGTGLIDHQDILAATKATIIADENAVDVYIRK